MLWQNPFSFTGFLVQISECLSQLIVCKSYPANLIAAFSLRTSLNVLFVWMNFLVFLLVERGNLLTIRQFASRLGQHSIPQPSI